VTPADRSFTLLQYLRPTLETAYYFCAFEPSSVTKLKVNKVIIVDIGLLGCNTVWTCVPTFQRNICRHLQAEVMEAVCSSETLASTYKLTRRYNPEDQRRHLHGRENLRSQKVIRSTHHTFHFIHLLITLFYWISAERLAQFLSLRLNYEDGGLGRSV
jgi:hypothetical protein